MNNRRWGRLTVIAAVAIVISCGRAYADSVSFAVPDPTDLERFIIASEPVRSEVAGEIEAAILGDPGDVVLPDVPTSNWWFGCSAVSAGMMFGYYDNAGYESLYYQPVPDSLDDDKTIIATNEHQSDYWEEVDATGQDPWEKEGRTEHEWADCPADFMGTNQWKWDNDGDGSVESNRDGATTLWSRGDGEPLYDYIPPEEYGLPRTALSHGLRLFAQSRGYNVLTNYTQRVDAVVSSGGFTFNDYMAEIDAGRPVMLQVTGHTMLGVGYNPTGDTVYLHNTWGNYVDDMTWGNTYDGRQHFAVNVIHLDPAQQAPEPGTCVLVLLGVSVVYVRRRMKDSA